MATNTRILVATGDRVLLVDPPGDSRVGSPGASPYPARGLDGRLPTCLASDAFVPHRVWCGTRDGGVLRSGDGGRSWEPAGLAGERVMALTASPVEEGVVWAGTEPSAVWRSADGGASWEPTRELTELPSSDEWSFPPRPETHHVRWIACHPHRAGRLWVAVEAGALVGTSDDGESWSDRVPGGPRDTHELAIHPDRPDTLRVAAGDGYFESFDGGSTWSSPSEGLEVGYLRSVAVDPGDPDVVVVSASSRAKTAYVAGESDGRLFRRVGGGADRGNGSDQRHGRWERVTEGRPDPPDTIAPLVRPGSRPGELWAADERGVHRSDDGGRSWRRVAAFDRTPENLRGFSVIGG